MKVLIACEFSGVVREAFRKLGHDAWSCDLRPDKSKSPFHIQGDVLGIIRQGWDLMIGHPPCDFLATCAAWAFKDPDFEKYPGVGYHQKVEAGTLTGEARRKAQEEGAEFFLKLYNAPVPLVAIENPVGCMGRRFRKANQTIQPYDFGDDASKRTCLWTRGLPDLIPTKYFPPRLVCSDCGTRFAYGMHKCPSCESHSYLPRWGNQTDSGQNKLSPSDDREALRSVTFPGIAEAMADQWGCFRLR